MVAALEVVQSSAREMGDKVQETVAETLVKVSPADSAAKGLR